MKKLFLFKNRILLLFIKNFFRLPSMFYHIVLKYKNRKKYTKEERYAYAHKITPGVVKSGNVDIICTGLENLPKENGYILFPNHQGMFDTLTFLTTHERQLAPIMKIETSTVPLLKETGAMLDALYMDREDIRQSLGIIKEMAENVQNGENYVIFPEGTRSRHGNVLGTFKHGCFKSALLAKCPIVPVCLIDCYKPFDIGSTDWVTVQVHYLKPLYYDEYKDMKSAEISEIVQGRIQAKMNEVLGEGYEANEPEFPKKISKRKQKKAARKANKATKKANKAAKKTDKSA